MKKLIYVSLLAMITFFISGCFGGGGSVTSKMEITKENYKDVIEDSFKVLSLVNDTDRMQNDLLDIIDSDEDIRAIGAVNESSKCQDGGEIKIDKNNSKQIASIVADKCSENGVYIDGKVDISIKESKVDENRVNRDISFVYNNFEYKNDKFHFKFKKAKNSQTIEKKHVEELDGSSHTITSLLKSRFEITGYAKNDRSEVEFDGFVFNFQLDKDIDKISFDGDIKFVKNNKSVTVKTIKPIEQNANTWSIDIKGGELKIIGNSSFLQVKFNSDNTIDIYYNAKEHIYHETAKSIIQNMR